jgi:hypothetical protein
MDRRKQQLKETLLPVRVLWRNEMQTAEGQMRLTAEVAQ